MKTVEGLNFESTHRDWWSPFFTGLTALAVVIILGFLAVILTNIIWQGWEAFSWRFITSNSDQNMFDVNQAGVLPMIIGTAARVMLMTVFVIPIGVITALYLTEYAPSQSPITTIIRSAVNNLAGVPSIVFGLFGLGFFVNFVGGNLDQIFRPDNPDPYWRNPALIWASLTLAVMTLPVVIVATEETLRALPPGLREASMALGATRLQTVAKVILPQALPGIMTGGILAVSRAGGEVAPILFTGAAYYMAGYPNHLTDQFMDLGYHIFILSTQSPNIERTQSILYATIMTLLMLTFTLNMAAIFVRARMRAKTRMFH
ncbi:MAG: Phosphate transport system permease protein PstA 2 [Verrucomicrobia subdivision 3 bacterium]|nr:Phosphate transport system permease protein PstA 2 [Limisphaerales bacterium]MCS1414744.1 Phosphate transport system permease protein PstA 2 [Limisphaerales bacterium]